VSLSFPGTAHFPARCTILPPVPELLTMPELLIGTSAFTADGWEASFYPRGMKPADYLSFYATKFNAVELDNTFYRAPALSTVKGWAAKTPPGFLFAAKIPQVITHEKVLVDCDSDLRHFLTTMDALGEKLGPLLFQFGYFNRSKFKSPAEFLAILKPFLKKLPRDHQFVIEIRNKAWLDAPFADLLREHGVALALIDQSWMPRLWELPQKFDPLTSDFTYVRWLGDRKGIEEQTKTWNKIVVNRGTDLKSWVDFLRRFAQNMKLLKIFAFANNHYAGHAPATVNSFLSLWNNK
jgi:uncharacterized protein YecE (DUF72 family)